MFLFMFLFVNRVAAATEQLKDTVQKLMTGSTDLNTLVGTIQKVHVSLNFVQNNIRKRLTEIFDVAGYGSVAIGRPRT